MAAQAVAVTEAGHSHQRATHHQQVVLQIQAEAVVVLAALSLGLMAALAVRA